MSYIPPSPHPIPVVLDVEPEHVSWPDVVETENPIIATLLGPDGDPIAQIRERRTVPFGYQKEPS